jgi:hypothetical protein
MAYLMHAVLDMVAAAYAMTGCWLSALRITIASLLDFVAVMVVMG